MEVRHRDPDDVLKSAESHENGRSKDSARLKSTVNDGNRKHHMELRTVILEKLS